MLSINVQNFNDKQNFIHKKRNKCKFIELEAQAAGQNQRQRLCKLSLLLGYEDQKGEMREQFNYINISMDPKQDYFRSPTPGNLLNLFSPFRLLRYDQDLNFINNSLTPLNRNVNNYISPYLERVDQHELQKRSKSIQLQQGNNQIKSRLSFDDESDQLQQSRKMETPFGNKIKITNIETTSRKQRKYDLRFTDSNQKHYVKDGQKGLRALSKQAFEVFHHSPSMTYQEVAEKIIQQNQQLNEYPQVHQVLIQKRKQRQSIKRRVYDALNVLIAVGVLQKVGKKISMSKKVKQETEKQTGAIKGLDQMSKKKAFSIQQKKKRLEQRKIQKQFLHKLIQRNKTRNEEESKINFPFVISKEVCEKHNNSQVKIKGFLCGDLDAICNLEIENNF